ncbi:MAG: carbohydrate kinase family protein [Lachnospiraceae bacterium]|nr:carbohydrate kinase family protein [Lachnospiraceae bacterium]
MKDVYICGDVNIDLLIPDVTSMPAGGQELVVDNMYTAIGGGAALTALGLAKLGVSVDFEGNIHSDMYGDYIMSEFKNAGVGTEHLHFSEKNKTGISLSFTNKDDRGFITYRGTNSEIDLDSVSIEHAKESRFMHVTGYSGDKHDKYLKLLKNVKKEGVKVSFDLGWDDSGLWYKGITELFDYIDVLFMNETEILHYSGCDRLEDAIDKFRRDGMILAVKCGKDGSVACLGDKIERRKGLSVKAVDTTGAGDSFNAGFLCGLLSGRDLGDSLMYGNIAGAMSVTGYGGNTAFPDKKKLLEIFESETRGD